MSLRWSLSGLIPGLMLAGAVTLAPARERGVEQLGDGVVVYWEEGAVEASGSCAADLRAPSAEVARIQAERVARERAQQHMRQALLALPKVRWAAGKEAPRETDLDPAVRGAETAAVDYGSNGSVSVRLRLKLAALPRALLPGKRGNR